MNAQTRISPCVNASSEVSFATTMNQLRLQGYIHEVSATKKSRSRSFPYFNFSLQVDDNAKRRAVCYDTAKHKLLREYQESREPVTLSNFTLKRSLQEASEDDIIVNKRTRIERANNNDIPYEYDESPSSSEPQPITIEEVLSLQENQLTSVKGTLTVRPDSIQQVLMNDGLFIPMLSRCAINDNTGTIRLTLWGDATQEVTNHECYTITNVRVKKYDSSKYLTTTPSSQITIAGDHFPPPTEEFFSSLFDTKTMEVDKIRLADSFKTWLACTKCNKQISDLTSTNVNLMKCPTCGVVQPASSCPISASIRIAVRDGKNHELIWLKVFSPALKTMMEQLSSDVTLESPEDEVYNHLFELENFAIEYNERSAIVKDIRFKS